MNYDSDMKKRELTDYEITSYQNLRRIWEEKKRSLELTQEKAAAAFGCSTSNIGHYLTGTQPLNIKTTIGFAKLLEVNAADIDPRLADLSPVLSDAELTLVRVFRRLDANEQSEVVDFATKLLLDKIENS